jgi:cell wall-associated NlpC family hydrolase
LEALPNYFKPSYTKYDYSQVQPGDLVYSANGFAIGDVNTGHMGIITG